MRALLALSMVMLSGTALAESENPPTATPSPEATATPVATPDAAANAPATPEPTPAATPVAAPAGSTVITAPSWASATDVAPLAPRPKRDPLGWEVEAAIHSQGVFDGGVHVFSEDSYLTGAELRVRKTMPGTMSRFSAAPELSYGAAHATRLYPGAATTELWLQRFQAGARASLAIDRLPRLRPVARAGATGLWGTALAHDSFKDHREEAFGFGAYVSGGFEADLGPAFTVLEPQQHLTLGLEVGHLYTGGLSFGEMGELGINGVYYSAQIGFRF